MKKIVTTLLSILFLLSLAGCNNTELIAGSKKNYFGTVTDRGMSVVNEGDRKGRPYIIIATEENTEICFWLLKDYETIAEIGDNVYIESAIEESTNLLVATRIVIE